MLLKISTSLYIFLLFNREFVPLIDLRFIILPIFLLLFLYKLIVVLKYKSIVSFGSKKYILYFATFIFIIFLTNIKWLFNYFEPRYEIFTNVIILYIYNFLAISIFALYWKRLDLKLIKIVFFISGVVLLSSIIAQYLGIENLPLSGTIRQMKKFEISVVGTRLGGYAEDPNYASFSMMIWFLVSLILYSSRLVIILVFFMAFVGIIFSFSKTIILALFIVLSFFIAKRIKLLIPYTILFFTVMISSILYLYELFETLSTMSIRFRMWDAAMKLFLESPIIGSGITSVRSNFYYVEGWYVQPHSSYFTLLADNGIFAFILYVLFIFLAFNLKDNRYKLLVGLLFFFSATYELFVFQYPYFVLGILPILVLLKQNRIYTTKIRI
jgi:O-antigen ligase